MQIMNQLLSGEVLTLLIILFGVGMMVGLIRRGPVFALLKGLLALLLISPLLAMLHNVLPTWIFLLVLGSLLAPLLQAFAAMFIGWRAADSMMGALAAEVVRFFFRILFLPLGVLRTIRRRV